MNAVIMLLYCVSCFVVAAAVMKFLKTSWVYFLVSSTLPPLLLTLADALWQGEVDSWAAIGFVVAWLIALLCASLYYVAIKIIDSRKRKHQAT
jgi:4-amino-4-deoxy-L-arabinose transferase-like glycosyltransferase